MGTGTGVGTAGRLLGSGIGSGRGLSTNRGENGKEAGSSEQILELPGTPPTSARGEAACPRQTYLGNPKHRSHTSEMSCHGSASSPPTTHPRSSRLSDSPKPQAEA